MPLGYNLGVYTTVHPAMALFVLFGTTFFPLEMHLLFWGGGV